MAVNVTELNKQIVRCHANGDKDGLSRVYVDLVKQRMKLDKFMTLFLDKFERKMSYEDMDTNIWNLYRKKYAEYETLSQVIQTAEFYLGRK